MKLTYVMSCNEPSAKPLVIYIDTLDNDTGTTYHPFEWLSGDGLIDTFTHPVYGKFGIISHSYCSCEETVITRSFIYECSVCHNRLDWNDIIWGLRSYPIKKKKDYSLLFLNRYHRKGDAIFNSVSLWHKRN